MPRQVCPHPKGEHEICGRKIRHTTKTPVRKTYRCRRHANGPSSNPMRRGIKEQVQDGTLDAQSGLEDLILMGARKTKSYQRILRML